MIAVTLLLCQTVIDDIPKEYSLSHSITDRLAAGKAYLGMEPGWLIPVEIDSPHDNVIHPSFLCTITNRLA